MFTFKFRVVLRFISYQLNNSFISIYLFDTFQVSTHYSYVNHRIVFYCMWPALRIHLSRKLCCCSSFSKELILEIKSKSIYNTISDLQGGKPISGVS